MHLRAEYQGILAPVTYQSTTPGKLERWLEENPQADVKQVKRRIRLSREEEQE